MLACFLCGCSNPSGTTQTHVTQTVAAEAQPSPAGDFQVSSHDPFDSGNAMDILKKQCEFGVRPLGTPAHEKTLEYLIAQMKLYADETKLQKFTYRGMPVTNVVGVFYPAGSDKPDERPIVLMTHWDTRPIADGPFSMESRRGVHFRYGPNGWSPQAPIMGANDAASGVAVLLELARIFKQKRPPVGVLLLLDDGEDYGDFTANDHQVEGTELGAQYFAKNFRTEKSFGMPKAGILLDMVGAKNAVFYPEDLSVTSNPTLNERVFNIARKLGYSDMFRLNDHQSVGDDHVSMNEAGIPTIDIIQPLPGGSFTSEAYRYWHTREDTPDKCSATTLKAVGDTIAETIYREAPSK